MWISAFGGSVMRSWYQVLPLIIFLSLIFAPSAYARFAEQQPETKSQTVLENSKADVSLKQLAFIWNDALGTSNGGSK